ncbi:MAG: response regulator, partial [Mesorhizobium sp.]
MRPVNRDTKTVNHLSLVSRNVDPEMLTDFTRVLVVGKSPVNRV